MFLASLGLGLSWPYGMLMSAATGVKELKAVNQYVQSLGWEGYSLQLGEMENSGKVVYVHLPGEEIHTCVFWVHSEKVSCAP